MDKYKFYIETENQQEIRKKGLLYSKILTVFLLFIPLMICSQADWSVITKLIIFGLCWFIFPFVTFSMGYNLNNYRFQTQFPSLLSVPMAALTIYLSLEAGEFPPTPVSTFQVLMLAFLTIAATHLVH